MKKINKQICKRSIEIFPAIFVTLIGVVDIIRYLCLGNIAALITISIFYILTLLIACGTYFCRLPILHLIPAVIAIILFSNMINWETTLYNFSFLVVAILLGIGAIGGTIAQILQKDKPQWKGWYWMACILVISGSLYGAQAGFTHNAKNRTIAQREIWAVPTMYDSVVAKQQGTVEEISYQTKSYAVDDRIVTKKANVYLPYGYSASKQYNILYLLHGTGDDENYWLKTFSYNKTMLDRMIEESVIDPLIVVTPTFYVEDDCLGGLDPLTYSFQKELRNDLMVAVEKKYSTYANATTEQGFKESRDHRAFAGLSRGAVTTLRSVFCGCLDYFSWFGTFSGSRTSKEYMQEHIQSVDVCDLPIHYYYVAGGTIDFALSAQMQDYKGLLSIDQRIKEGVNSNFDTFPMKNHSMGLWHLALYNFLQKIF